MLLSRNYRYVPFLASDYANKMLVTASLPIKDKTIIL